MRESVCEAWPEADFAAAVVFIDMLKSDDREAAEAASALMQDARMRCFHDPHHLAGLTFARTFGWQHHVAWDSYLFYPAGVRWESDALPAPPLWFHQLQDREVWEEQTRGQENTEWTAALPEQSEAPPERFRTGPDLVAALHQAASEVLAQRSQPGRTAASA